MRFTVPIIALVLLASQGAEPKCAIAANNETCRCHKPKQGPMGLPGPTGPQGPTGAILTQAFISANGSMQTQSNDIGFVAFDLPDVAEQNILHPVGIDTTQFEIEVPGVYLIGWNLSLANFTTTDQVFINLTLDGVVINSTRELVNLVSPFFSVISGQTIQLLTTGDIIQLQLTHFTTSTIEINNPSLIMTKIAD